MIYGDDLAYVHNAGFADYSLNAAPGVLQLLAKRSLQGETVIDLGCGPGQLLRALVQAKYHVIGIDASPACVRLARRVAPGATVQLGSIWNHPLPECSAITALGEVVSYLPSGTSRPPSLERLFSRIHGALRKDGLFVFDMLIHTDQQPMEYRTWRAGSDWAVMIDVSEETGRSLVKRKLDIFRRQGNAYRRLVERHTLRVVWRREIVDLLHELGFAVRTSKAYGKFVLPHRRMMFHARRL